MRDLAERLLTAIRKHESLRPGDRVAAAVSGGADSVALLFLLAAVRVELGVVLSVAHVNHKLRGAESAEDEHFTADLAARLGLEFDLAIAPIEAGASSVESAGGAPNMEASARRLRYEFFRSLGEQGRANKIVTAHTLDDQAETVLLRIFRGTGIRGLAGIRPRMSLEHWSAANGGIGAPGCKGKNSAGENIGGKNFAAEVVRPLLTFRRAELRDYLRAHGEAWREDSSNDDPSFTRNRIRRRLLPLIAEEFGESAVAHMAELAEIARAEEEHSAEEFDFAESSDFSLDAKKLLACPLAIQRRLVRGWIETNAPEASISFPLVEEILQLARGDAGQKIELPGSVPGNLSRNVRRGRAEIVIETAASSSAGQYEYTLQVPGAVDVPEIGAGFVARIVETASLAEGQPGALLDAAEVGDNLTIRNWRPGDRYWPAHTAREKKVKELLADLHATGAKKKLWPVAVDGQGRIVWMRGFAAPEAFRPRTGKAIWIGEIAADS